MSENIIGMDTYTNSMNFCIFIVYSYRLTLAEVIGDVAGSGESVLFGVLAEYAPWRKRATACSERKIKRERAAAAAATSNNDE